MVYNGKHETKWYKMEIAERGCRNRGCRISSDEEGYGNMRIRRKVLTGTMLGLLLTAAVYGAFSSEISFRNDIKTGSVRVIIAQFEETDEGRVAIDPGAVLANQDVSYIPEVTNLRADSYVRVKVELLDENEGSVPVTLDSIYGLNDEWIRKGEYFYCKEQLGPSESSEVFEGIHIPEDWSEETASGFKVRLTADAVQAANFDPDFSADAPWGDICICEEKQDDNITYRTAKAADINGKVMTFSADGSLESSTKNLFGDFSYFMAGDKFRDVLKIENAAAGDVRISFCTEVKENILTEQAELKIMYGTEVIYDGPLTTEPLYEYFPLTEVRAGGTESLTFEVCLPEGSENEYSVLDEEVVWKFRAETAPAEDGAVQTGDGWSPPLYGAAVLAAAAVMILLAAGKREKRK